jgi:D-proline reductase (dithiol) PrdB
MEVEFSMAHVEKSPDHGDSGVHRPDDLRTFETKPWVSGPPLNQRRVAIVTTAGVHMPSDHPFQWKEQYGLYRIIPGDVHANDLVMSHGEPSFDRTGFQQDYNIVFPIDRLREMVADGIIGSVADFHYSFGAHLSPEEHEIAGREVGRLLKKDKVTAALFFPV